MVRRWLPALLAVPVLLCCASAAPAATVSADLREDEESGELFGPVVYRAAPGERNRLTVSRDAGRIRFTDVGAPVDARGDCEQIDAHRAVCPFSEAETVLLGDGDDTARLLTTVLTVEGGTGDDVLLGSSGSDDLDGGPGSDRLDGRRGRDDLTGGPGRDHVIGGRGDDYLFDGETDAQAARDVLDGGPSARSPRPATGDIVSYERRRRSLRIDLGSGGTGTEDRLTALESVRGGRGNDRLSGSNADNTLEGGGGADVLHGRGGNDVPMGGTGNDRVHGDDGDDVLWGQQGGDSLFGGRGDDFVDTREEAGGPAADAVDCGPGKDDRARSDRRDTLTASCRTAVVFGNALEVRTLPKLDADSADFWVTCSYGTGPDGCQGRLALTDPGGRPLGAKRFLIREGRERATVSIPLTRAAAVLRAGTIVQVDFGPDRGEDAGGYRIFMRAR